MTTKQREGTVRALFDWMFGKKKQNGKNQGGDRDGFKLKHGRGNEVNKDLFAEDDATG